MLSPRELAVLEKFVTHYLVPLPLPTDDYQLYR